MPTQQDLDALVKRLEALEAENAKLRTELSEERAVNTELRVQLSEERAARQALEEQLHQSRYEKGLRMALQSYKLSICRSCKKIICDTALITLADYRFTADVVSSTNLKQPVYMVHHTKIS
jgi:regulator of replication initiation timing